MLHVLVMDINVVLDDAILIPAGLDIHIVTSEVIMRGVSIIHLV